MRDRGFGGGRGCAWGGCADVDVCGHGVGAGGVVGRAGTDRWETLWALGAQSPDRFPLEGHNH